MTCVRMGCLLGMLGLAGCVQLPMSQVSLFGPAREETTKSKMENLSPIAAPPPISARFVNGQNAHEITEALWNEIERDLHSPAAPKSEN